MERHRPVTRSALRNGKAPPLASTLGTKSRARQPVVKPGPSSASSTVSQLDSDESDFMSALVQTAKKPGRPRKVNKQPVTVTKKAKATGKVDLDTAFVEENTSPVMPQAPQELFNNLMSTSKAQGSQSQDSSSSWASSSSKQKWTKEADLTDTDNIEEISEGLKRMVTSPIASGISNFIYHERFQTFLDGHWPDWHDESKGSTSGNAEAERNCRKRKLEEFSGFKPRVHFAEKVRESPCCSADELAMAGFYLRSSVPHTIRCFVCCATKDTHLLTKETDPWQVHVEINPACPLIHLGKPNEPDDYTMEEVFFLLGECQALKLESELTELEKMAAATLDAINKSPSEIAAGKSLSH